MRAPALLSSISLHVGLLAAGALVFHGLRESSPRQPLLVSLQAPPPAFELPPPPDREPVVVEQPADAVPDPTDPVPIEQPPADFAEPAPRPEPGPIEHDRMLPVPPIDQRLTAEPPPRPNATEAPPQPPERTEPQRHEPAPERPAAPTVVAPRELPGKNRDPEYPRLAWRRGWTGEVLLDLEIDALGHVTALRLSRSSGHPILDRAAEQAVRDWLFAPATRDDVPIAARHQVSVEFRIDDER